MIATIAERFSSDRSNRSDHMQTNLKDAYDWPNSEILTDRDVTS